MRRCGLAILWISALLLAGCIQQPSGIDESLSLSIPQVWTSESGVPASQSWLADFNDSQLEALVREALSGNLQLQAGIARLDQAAAFARINRADRWPSVNLGGSAQRFTSLMNRSAADSFSLNGTVSWEADLWGRVRAQVTGAEADLLAAESDFEGLRISIAGFVAQAWFAAIEARNQEDLSRETVESFEANLLTVEERFQRGLSPALDLRLTRANVASARATYNQQKRVADNAVRTLEVLLGRYPGASLQTEEELPVLNSPIPAGVPADLLSRRPDVLSSYQRLVSADAGWIESKRALLPSINLTGQYGWTSSELDNLLKDGFDVWSLLGNVTAPVFQGGRLRANVARTEAARAEAVANYQDTILTAFREVEAGLAGEILLQQQLAAVTAAAEESIGAQELAEERYERGLVNIVTVLEAQRRAFNAKSNMIQVQAALLQNRLALYLALGGGF
ncbi:MAG: efflux transporter outer membrane subunit [Puniceicoccaceae bacterium]